MRYTVDIAPNQSPPLLEQMDWLLNQQTEAEEAVSDRNKAYHLPTGEYERFRTLMHAKRARYQNDPAIFIYKGIRVEEHPYLKGVAVLTSTDKASQSY